MKRINFWGSFILLVMFLLTLSITLTINSTWVYQLNLKYGNFLPLVNLDAKQMLHNFKQLMNYLNNPFILNLKMDNFYDSSSGLKHFKDVKTLFLINYIILIITCYPSFLFIKKLYKNKEQWRLIWPLQVIFGLLFFMVTMMLIEFDDFFILFHKILFKNGDWVFYPIQDPIINALPESYFQQCFILFFVILLIFLGILYFWGQSYFKHNKKRI